MTKPRKIKFQGEEYWLANSDWAEFYISPLNHYSEDGKLLANPFYDISYAIVENGGKIMRFGKQIGDLIKDVEYI